MPQTLANYNQSLSDNLNISSFIAVQKVYAFLNFKSSNFFFQIKYPHIKFVSLTQVRKNTVHPPYLHRKLCRIKITATLHSKITQMCYKHQMELPNNFRKKC